MRGPVIGNSERLAASVKPDVLNRLLQEWQRQISTTRRNTGMPILRTPFHGAWAVVGSFVISFGISLVTSHSHSAMQTLARDYIGLPSITALPVGDFVSPVLVSSNPAARKPAQYSASVRSPPPVIRSMFKSERVGYTVLAPGLSIVSSKTTFPRGAMARRTTFRMATAFSSSQSWITRERR